MTEPPKELWRVAWTNPDGDEEWTFADDKADAEDYFDELAARGCTDITVHIYELKP